MVLFIAIWIEEEIIIIDMKVFFDYIFYRLYLWNEKLDKSFSKLVPIKSDALFSAIWGLSVLQAFNLFVLYNGILLLLGCRNYTNRVDYILSIALFITYLCNYFLYQYSNKYKFVFDRNKKKKYSDYTLIIYVVSSIALALFALWFMYSPDRR